MTSRLLAIHWSWRKVAMLQIVTTIVVVAAIWLGSWIGRSEVVVSQRSSCERGQNDRVVIRNTNADLDTLADVIGHLDGVSAEDRFLLDAVSDRADERIQDEMSRLSPALNCTLANPDPGPFAIPGRKTTNTPPPLDQPQSISVPRR